MGDWWFGTKLQRFALFSDPQTPVGSIGSATGIVTIDISSADHVLNPSSRGLMVGVTGDVKVTMADGSVGILPALAPGIEYSVAVSKVWKDGTSASSIVALL